MTVEIKSVLCEDLINPPAGARLVYRFIESGTYPNYEWAEVSSFLSGIDSVDGVASDKDVIRAVDSLRTQANDDHHIFIEGFEKTEDGSYEVVLGS